MYYSNIKNNLVPSRNNTFLNQAKHQKVLTEHVTLKNLIACEKYFFAVQVSAPKTGPLSEQRVHETSYGKTHYQESS